MAIQNDPDLAGFEGYISVAEGDALDILRGTAPAWTSQTTEQKEVSIRLSSEYIDSKFNFKGTEADVSQTMQYPRTGNVPYDEVIPDVLKRATYVLARDGATNVLYTNIVATASVAAGDIKSSERVLGPIKTKTEYYSGSSSSSENQTVFSELALILKPLLQGSRAGR